MQAAICIGYVTPLFITYLMEARAKLAFARRNRLLLSAVECTDVAVIAMPVVPSVDNAAIMLMRYVNLVFFCCIAGSAAVQYASP